MSHDIEGKSDDQDMGLQALAMVAAFHQVPCDPLMVRHDLGIGHDPMDAASLVRAAKRLGMKARLVERQGLHRLDTLPLPAILEMADGQFLILSRRMGEGLFRIVDARAKSAIHVTSGDLEGWIGTAVLTGRRNASSRTAKSAMNWVIDSVKRYRKPLASVVLTSVFLQVCTLASPLLFQAVIDKVLVHHGTSTLDAMVIALLLIGACQATLQYLRGYIMAHTASRIDVELGVRLISHMFRLPLSYFEQRADGQTVARVRELETIRSFFTGQGMTAILDAPIAVLFLIVLFSYSVPLATVVTFSLPCYVLVAVGLKPLLRDRTLERFARNAAGNQLIVETVVGMQTVKSMAVEPVMRAQWEDRLAGYVRSSFQAGNLANLGQSAIQFINRATTAFILLLGARAVMAGDMTVGGLVAFNMIAGQLSAPVLRLSQFWQDYQEVRVSVERLGDILEATPETHATSEGPRGPVNGTVTFQNVAFRYGPEAPWVLKGVTLNVPAGQVIGIVGASGSGKSTLTKLVQRLHVPEQGRVLVDGHDLANAEPSGLRRQIGVVLQDSFVFNRTVAQNIALADPRMSRQQVVMAAKLAGADEFIRSMPQGYDTILEERGANLSGGQRQRIAIARALATNPRVLILDEATSALDYESERAIQRNMSHIIQGRTVIVIAHRLAAVRHCDRIISMHDGRIVEDGTHQQLVTRKDGLYARLWAMQFDDIPLARAS